MALLSKQECLVHTLRKKPFQPCLRRSSIQLQLKTSLSNVTNLKSELVQMPWVLLRCLPMSMQKSHKKHKRRIWQVNACNQTVPSWTGFNIKTQNMIAVSQDVVEYLPTINAPATEMSTVLETLNQSELLRQELKLHQIVVVMDQTFCGNTRTSTDI